METILILLSIMSCTLGSLTALVGLVLISRFYIDVTDAEAKTELENFRANLNNQFKEEEE